MPHIDKNYFNATLLAKNYEVATGKRRDVSSWIGTRQASRCISKLSEKIGCSVDVLVCKIMTGKNEDRGTWMHPDLEKSFQSWLVDKQAKENKEQEIQEKMWTKIKGQKEVPTLAGSIDLLTRKELVEIKSVKSWKCAVGQVLVYGQDYPKHKKRIHLFGKASPSFLSMVRQYCTILDIEVTWEE